MGNPPRKKHYFFASLSEWSGACSQIKLQRFDSVMKLKQRSNSVYGYLNNAYLSIQYVHELQNLYLDLTGEELTIL